MEDQQSNPTEPEHPGIEMTNPEQPTKQAGSFPESAERPSTSSQRSSREQVGHQVFRYNPPTQDDAMHGIVKRSGRNRSPAASASGQSIAQLPQLSRRCLLDVDANELTWAELYPVYKREQKYLSENRLSTQMFDRDDLDTEITLEQSSLEQDQQSNPTEPDYPGIEMTNPEQPTKQVGSFPESAERPSTSSQRSSREQVGHQVFRYNPPTQDHAMHGIVRRSGRNRSPAASASGQSIAQLPQRSRRCLLDVDANELTWAELYPVWKLEQKYLSENRLSTQMFDRDDLDPEITSEQSSPEQRVSKPRRQLRRPRKLSPEDYSLPLGSELEYCRFLLVIVVVSILNFGVFGLVVILWTFFR